MSTQNGLLQIAEQCPDIGGAAVYRARSILRNYNQAYVEPNCDDLIASFLESRPTEINTIESSVDDKQYEVIGQDWRVYPNPAEDEINIDVFLEDITIPYTIQMMNSQGKVVHYRESSDLKITMITSEFPAGIYFITLKDKVHLLTKRVVIQ